MAKDLTKLNAILFKMHQGPDSNMIFGQSKIPFLYLIYNEYLKTAKDQCVKSWREYVAETVIDLKTKV